MDYFEKHTHLKFRDRQLEPGTKVYVLIGPSNQKSKPEYQIHHYKEGVFTNASISNKTRVEDGQLFLSDRKEVPVDETFILKYHIKYPDGSWTVSDRKHLYFEDEYEQLVEDMNKLNDILAVKRKYNLLLDNYINEIKDKSGWDYNNYELTRNQGSNPNVNYKK